jgi:two-component system nitrate/nitrite response regulator NarL
MPISSIRVFLLTENKFLRESLVRLFRKRSDFTVVGHASSGEENDLAFLESNCDVLVGDCFVLNSLSASFSERTTEFAGMKIILLGMKSDEEEFMEAVRSGISGYLLQDASGADVIATVRAVYRGETVCPPQLCAALFSFVVEASKKLSVQNSSSKPDLTLRQHQLVALVAKGLTNKEIASQLNLSEFTVRNHIHRILKRLDAETRNEAVETMRAQGSLLSV